MDRTMIVLFLVAMVTSVHNQLLTIEDNQQSVESNQASGESTNNQAGGESTNQARGESPNQISQQSIFGNLPKGNYTADTASSMDKGGLQGLFNMATGFINTVFKPFSELADVIGDMIKSGNILGWIPENWQRVASFDAGFIACLVFGMLFIVLVPLVGAIMCCCRSCCGNCGGRYEQSTARSKSCWRHCLCVTMLILTILMAIPTIFVFQTNNWITDVIDSAPNKIVAVLDDTSEYLNVVPKQINYVAKQYDTVDANVRPLVADLGTSVGIPFQEFVRAASVDTLAALGGAAKVQEDAMNAIAVVNTSVVDLEIGMAALDTSFTTLRTNMTAVPNLSDNDCQTDVACFAVFSSASKLDVGFDISLVTPLRDDLTSVSGDLGAYNIGELLAEVQDEIDRIPRTVRIQTLRASRDAAAALDSASGAIGQVSSNLPTDSFESIDQMIEGIKDQTTNAIAYYDDKFDKHRNTAGIILACILLFIVGCYFLGILLGVCGNDSKTSPANRGVVSNCGGIFLMVGVGLSFIFSWLLMILVVVLFTIGGHGERYACQGLDEPKYEALGLIESAAGLNISATLKLPPEAELTLTSLLKACKYDQSVYSALKLEYVYNVSAYLGGVSQQMNALKGELDASVNAVDLDSLVIYTKQHRTNLLALTETNLQSINFTEYLGDLGSGVTKTDLTAYAVFLRTTATNFSGAAIRFQDLVNDYADRVDLIQANEVVNMQVDYANLETSINGLINIAGSLNTTLNQLDSSLATLNGTIQSESRNIVQKIADSLYSQIYGNVTAYTDWAGKQVIKEVGACRPLYSAYAVTVGVFCDYIIDTTNGLWFSLGWCLFFLLPAAIVAMKLMKFYRKMSFEEVFEDAWDDMEMRGRVPSGNKAKGAHY